MTGIFWTGWCAGSLPSREADTVRQYEGGYYGL